MEHRKNDGVRWIWRMGVIDTGLRLWNVHMPVPYLTCASCVRQNWRWSFFVPGGSLDILSAAYIRKCMCVLLYWFYSSKKRINALLNQ